VRVAVEVADIDEIAAQGVDVIAAVAVNSGFFAIAAVQNFAEIFQNKPIRPAITRNRTEKTSSGRCVEDNHESVRMFSRSPCQSSLPRNWRMPSCVFI